MTMVVCNDVCTDAMTWGRILMRRSRSRNRDEDERYRKRTSYRLRGVGAAKRVNDDEAEQVEARLKRMNYGATRNSSPDS
jgi:hypothetical protein